MGLAELAYQEWEEEEDNWAYYGIIHLWRSDRGSHERGGVDRKSDGGEWPETMGREGSGSLCLPEEQSGIT